MITASVSAVTEQSTGAATNVSVPPFAAPQLTPPGPQEYKLSSSKNPIQHLLYVHSVDKNGPITAARLQEIHEGRLARGGDTQPLHSAISLPEPSGPGVELGPSSESSESGVEPSVEPGPPKKRRKVSTTTHTTTTKGPLGTNGRPLRSHIYDHGVHFTRDGAEYWRCNKCMCLIPTLCRDIDFLQARRNTNSAPAKTRSTTCSTFTASTRPAASPLRHSSRLVEVSLCRQ